MAWLTALWNLLVHYWPAVFAVLLPFIANKLADSKATGPERGWIAAVLSLLVGVLAPLVAGIHLTPDTIIVFATAVFTSATTAYLVFKRFRVTCSWLDALLKS
jgi:hypothetical protein